MIEQNTAQSSQEFEASAILDKVGMLNNEMAELADDIQITLGGLVADGDLRPGHRASMSIQELDRISQTLRSIGRLVHLVSKTGCAGVVSTSDLRATISLDSVFERFEQSSTSLDEPQDEFWS